MGLEIPCEEFSELLWPSPRPPSLRTLVLRYLALAEDGRPVHEWPA